LLKETYQNKKQQLKEFRSKLSSSLSAKNDEQENQKWIDFYKKKNNLSPPLSHSSKNEKKNEISLFPSFSLSSSHQV